jgi:putative MATE family efflux protein
MNNKHSFMGEEKINTLFWKLSIPSISAMMILALYYISDTIFVGIGIGDKAIGALSLIFPVILLIYAVSMGVGVGASSLISRKLGENDIKTANKVFGNFISITFLFILFFQVINLLFIEKIIYILGSTQSLFQYSIDYYRIILYGTTFIIFVTAYNNIIRSQGYLKESSIITIVGSMLNLFLNYIFIFKFSMGVSGAALGTIISYMVSFLLSVQFFLSKKNNLSLELKNLIIDKKIFSEMFHIGISSFLRLASLGFVNIVVNVFLRNYGGGDIAIEAFGIVFRISILIILPIIGIGMAMEPIIGYNFGKKQPHRIRKLFILSLKNSFYIIIFLYLIVMFFPNFFIGLFTKNAELINYTNQILYIALIMIPIISFNLISASYYMAKGDKQNSFIIINLRQIILLIPLLYIFTNLYKLNGVWIAFPIADMLCCIITYFFIVKELEYLKKLYVKQNVVLTDY